LCEIAQRDDLQSDYLRMVGSVARRLPLAVRTGFESGSASHQLGRAALAQSGSFVGVRNRVD